MVNYYQVYYKYTVTNLKVIPANSVFEAKQKVIKPLRENNYTNIVITKVILPKSGKFD